MNSDNKVSIQYKAARIISVIFHPVFMVVYGLTILLFAPTFLEYLPPDIKKILYLVVIVNNVLVPLTLLPVFRYRNLISSYDIENKSERIIPLLTASILYCTTSFIVFRFQIPFLLKSFIFATSVLSIIVSVINFWWKISIHAVGAGALTATILILSIKMHTSLTWYLIASILASGLILTARLRLNSHNLSEVWIGFLTGLLGIGLFILFV
jgi:hypothetical protein